jgi:hypothetical protein
LQIELAKLQPKLWHHQPRQCSLDWSTRSNGLSWSAKSPSQTSHFSEFEHLWLMQNTSHLKSWQWWWEKKFLSFLCSTPTSYSYIG